MVATHYYDVNALNRLGLYDICWLFAQGGMDQFLETRDHTYRDVTLEFLSTLHVEVTSGPRFEEGYIFFYLNREFYELNLSAFNNIFGFLPSMDLPYHHVPKEFNPNAFWYELYGDHWYDTSNSKDIIIPNAYICVAQQLLACGLFAWEDSLNVPRLSEVYFLYSMLEGDRIGPWSFLANQLYSAATSSAHRVVIGGRITTIARLVRVELNLMIESQVRSG